MKITAIIKNDFKSTCSFCGRNLRDGRGLEIEDKDGKRIIGKGCLYEMATVLMANEGV